MKNILVFDDGQDYFYDVHSVSLEDFDCIFPGPDQNVEFHDDLYERPDITSLDPVFKRMWFNRRRNSQVAGLHGMLFYENWDRKPFYPLKQDFSCTSNDLDIVSSLHGRIVLVVDRAPDEPIVACQIDVDLFNSLFSLPEQDVTFFEDVEESFGHRQALAIVSRLKKSAVPKEYIVGIQATFYIGYGNKRMYFPTRVDADIPRHYPLNIDASPA